MNADKQILLDALTFHGHKCWASASGVRAGLAAMKALGVERSGAKSLHAIIENGYYHGAMCFGDGVQYATGCTFGKGNMEKDPKVRIQYASKYAQSANYWKYSIVWCNIRKTFCSRSSRREICSEKFWSNNCN